MKSLRELLINYLMTTSTNPYWEKKNPTIIKNTDQALKEIDALLPREKECVSDGTYKRIEADVLSVFWKQGYNQALKDVRERLGI